MRKTYGMALVVLVALAALWIPGGWWARLSFAAESPPVAPAGEAVSRRAQPAMLYIHNAPESETDVRYDYHWMILRMALEKTAPKYGPYTFASTPGYMVEQRQLYELQHATGKLTVLVRGATDEYEKALHPVRIPVDKGLLGYRVFLIRAEDQPLYGASTTLEDLRRRSIGQGSDWKDVEILRDNGFTVVGGEDYEGLFLMLANRRFDLFSRGVEEVTDEYENHKAKIPSLKIEDHLMLLYPMARYFWFSKTPEGERLAARVHEGMMMMVEDGSFDRIFNEHHGRLIERLRLKSRKLFILENRHLPNSSLLQDKRLWYDPTQP